MIQCQSRYELSTAHKFVFIPTHSVLILLLCRSPIIQTIFADTTMATNHTILHSPSTWLPSHSNTKCSSCSHRSNVEPPCELAWSSRIACLWWWHHGMDIGWLLRVNSWLIVQLMCGVLLWRVGAACCRLRVSLRLRSWYLRCRFHCSFWFKPFLAPILSFLRVDFRYWFPCSY